MCEQCMERPIAQIIKLEFKSETFLWNRKDNIDSSLFELYQADILKGHFPILNFHECGKVVSLNVGFKLLATFNKVST